ncbi:hypothetical protein MWH93_004406 [Salmonella enterica]|nr:hypothetical protein [Salmonella enterica]EJA3502378.1 hypothetical protein [Salmonella enterica]EMC7070746.1 hypothetical protein [Salmonella enterica]HCM4410441.1 hypothetical protein [Salmonella enterica subsp. enterica serovar Agona]
MNAFIKIFYIVLALIWMPAIAAMVGNTLSMLNSGFSDVPTWVLIIALGALSLNVTCYLYFKKRNKNTSFLKYPFVLFCVSLILMPLAWGYTKTMSDPLSEKSQTLVNGGGVSFHIPLDNLVYAVLTAAPILAAAAAIIITAVNMYEALSNSNKLE